VTTIAVRSSRTVRSSRPRIRQATTHLAVALLAAGLAVTITLSRGHEMSAPAPRAPATLCNSSANATPGSPAAFRLADETASHGGC
jgi:hypothetical protein